MLKQRFTVGTGWAASSLNYFYVVVQCWAPPMGHDINLRVVRLLLGEKKKWKFCYQGPRVQLNWSHMHPKTREIIKVFLLHVKKNMFLHPFPVSFTHCVKKLKMQCIIGHTVRHISATSMRNESLPSKMCLMCWTFL